MIIDMHTHIFPEKIAERTLDTLAETFHSEPFTKGTADSLAESAAKAGIDLSVILPVVTKPKQFESVTRFAEQFHSKPLYSFGGIHPASENYKEELRYLKDHGFIGIKLHPDYQGMYFNDIRMKRVIDYASELGFVIVTHAGDDPLSPDDIHCTPQMAREVIHEVRPEKLVLAHMGGSMLWDEVEEYILGENVYLDTAYVLRRIPQERLLKMFEQHSYDKILFATDSPWSDQKEDADYLRALPVTENHRDKIAWKNAADLLQLKKQDII